MTPTDKPGPVRIEDPDEIREAIADLAAIVADIARQSWATVGTRHAEDHHAKAMQINREMKYPRYMIEVELPPLKDKTDWSRYLRCTKCHALTGEPCFGTGEPHREFFTPHAERKSL